MENPVNTRQNLQEPLLKALCQTECEVSIYLVNGIRMTGVIVEVDNYVVLLKSARNQSMVYKHAISTIVPTRPISLQRSANNSSNSVEIED